MLIELKTLSLILLRKIIFFHTRAYTYRDIYKCIYTHMYTHTHTYIHTHNRVLLSYTKIEIMPFAATQTDTEIIILSEAS